MMPPKCYYHKYLSHNIDNANSQQNKKGNINIAYVLVNTYSHNKWTSSILPSWTLSV